MKIKNPARVFGPGFNELGKKSLLLALWAEGIQ